MAVETSVVAIYNQVLSETLVCQLLCQDCFFELCYIQSSLQKGNYKPQFNIFFGYFLLVLTILIHANFFSLLFSAVVLCHPLYPRSSLPPPPFRKEQASQRQQLNTAKQNAIR